MAFTATMVTVLLLLLASSWPAWRHSREWGYYPFACASVLLVAVIVLQLFHSV